MNVECARAEVYNYHFPKDNSGERLYCCCKPRNVPVWAVYSMQLTYISDPSFPLAAEGFMSDATVDIVLPDVPDGGTYSAVNHSCCIFWTNGLYLTVYVQIYSSSTCSQILKWSHTPFWCLNWCLKGSNPSIQVMRSNWRPNRWAYAAGVWCAIIQIPSRFMEVQRQSWVNLDLWPQNTSGNHAVIRI